MRWLVVLVVVLACKSPRNEIPANTGSGSASDRVIEPGITHHTGIPLSITRAYTGRKPTELAPYHAPGGTWTYIEANVYANAQAPIVIGIEPAEAEGFATAFIVPTTKAAGELAVGHLGHEFGTPVPPPAAGQLVPLEVKTALLGRGLDKQVTGGFAGAGTWDAWKWFCETDDVEATEVYFNLSLATKQAELVLNDLATAPDLMSCMAVALRDGAPPPRTAENDPTLAPSGPRLVLGKQLTTGQTHEIAITPARVLLVEERAGKAVLIDVDPETGTTKDLYTTKDRIELGHCDDTATRCVLVESTPTEDRNVFTGSDPQRLMLLDHRVVTPLVVPAVGQRPEVTRRPVSPDGRIVVIRTSPGGPVTRLIAWNPTTGLARTTAGSARTTIEVTVRGETDVVGWRKGGDSWVASLASTEEDKPPAMFDWRVDEIGTLAPSKAAMPGLVAIGSPDGSRRAQFTGDGKLTITPATGAARTLVFHKSDRRYLGPDCCTWLDNRYLELRGERVGFIDTDAMKVSFAAEQLADDARLEIIYGLRKALVMSDRGAQLATIEGP